MNLEVPSKLIPAFHNLTTNQYDAIVWKGGRGGAKSQALVAIGILESYIDDGVILCCREIQKSIDDSLYQAIVSGIEDRGLKDNFKIIRDEITNLVTGARFIFAGLKTNITSIKSINKLRVVLVDEAENVTQNSWDVLRPTPRYGNTRLYVVFNPRFEADATWQEFIERQDDRTLVITINWQDNPWFPASLNNQRLRDARGDAGRYQWIWGGNFLKISDASVLGKKIRSEYFDIDESFGDPLIGIDWGFSNDPTAITESYVRDQILYIRRAADRVGLELDDTPAWLIKHVPNVKLFTSRADSSRPETISKVKNDSKNPLRLIKACKKYSGCVEEGIAHLQSYKAIIVHPEADACLAELTAYSYKKDKFDEPTSVLQDKDNHYADSLRYGVEPLIGGRKWQAPATGGTRVF